MSLVNNSANNFKDFLDAIKPYLNYQFYDMSGQGVEANNFSTDEKVIGTWTDGKPLYQKTVNFTLPASNVKIDTGISGVDFVGYVSAGSTLFNGNDETVPLDTAWYNNNGTTFMFHRNNGGSLQLRFLVIDDWIGSSGKITLRYTKTTDTAVASGEKIVGQWIDGKPVYEKVFEKTLDNVNYDTNYDFDISDLSIDEIAKIDVLSSYSNLWELESACWMQSNNVLRARQRWTNNSGTVTVRIILRYTKTTD